MDIEITLHVLDRREGSCSDTLLSLVERQALYVSRDRLRAVRSAQTQITLLSARLDRWSVPYNFFDNRATIEQLARLSNIIEGEILKMARTPKKTEYSRPEWKGFLDYTLNEQELEAADAWKLTPAQMWEGINTLTAEGYRLTVSYSKQLTAYTATLQAGSEQGSASGWALSARDVKAEGALKLLLWKHFIGMDGDWKGLTDAPKRATRG